MKVYQQQPLFFSWLLIGQFFFGCIVPVAAYMKFSMLKCFIRQLRDCIMLFWISHRKKYSRMSQVKFLKGSVPQIFIWSILEYFDSDNSSYEISY